MINWEGQAELTSDAKSIDNVFDPNSSPHFCKPETTKGSASTSPLCPRCKSKKVWRDAFRYSVYGDKIQRWLCRDCGLRFSDPEDVKNSWSNQEKTAQPQLSDDIKMVTNISYF